MLEDKYKDLLVDTLCQCIRIPSCSSAKGGTEGELQTWVARRMGQIGARVKTFEVDDVPGFRRHPLCCGPDRQYKGRPTVLGEFGPEKASALLVMAHSDTVQVNRPDEWTFDPFCGDVRDRRVCGLGASDDKWGIASMLTIMQALQESGNRYSKRVIFASTIDEENGVGNGLLLLMLANLKAESALYLDGGEMDICIGNMGGSNLRLQPKSAVESGTFIRHARLLETACREISRQRRELFNQRFFEKNATREHSVMFLQKEDERGSFFLIPFYTLPGEGRADFCHQLEKALSNALEKDFSLYTVSYREPWFEPALIPEKTPLVQSLSMAAREILAREPHITTISKQDAFVLTNHANIPTVSFGIGKGTMFSDPGGRGGYHQPDECVTIDDLWSGCRIAYSTIRRWLEDRAE